MENEKYMRRAIELARLGEGWCHPNPLVGAVIVKDGNIIGEGFHERYGSLHAERNAIKNLSESAEGATLYVTLEPCCHHGKQPPCTEAVLECGIKKVVIGSRDPNPKVAGKGVKFLKENGIEVVEDFLKDECDELNPVFFHFITTKKPYVTMKYAMTMDGKIATKTGRSRWITGEKARRRVQEMRHAHMGIMVGIGTVLADDPMLNCRIPGGRSPVRIICDSQLRIPLASEIVKTANEYSTIVACGIPGVSDGELDPEYGFSHDLSENLILGDCHEDSGVHANISLRDISFKLKELGKAGIAVINCYPEDRVTGSGVDLQKLMTILGERGIDSILLEGGGTLNESALKAGIVNEIDAFIAPKIFAGNAKTPVIGLGVENPEDAYRCEIKEVEQIGEDMLIRYRVSSKQQNSTGNDSCLPEPSTVGMNVRLKDLKNDEDILI
ncbi:MAG: bifunctional diaminohydroxyphosphoribosylaminopyrimidine deaminase/5-amino-6-(5-phosphoribosylamino)uracil reductase RibD [Oribacterium sp.]|nr:bifunctional diaminohydroxyphosphoribosylaminopyrimidine deaminase/5-amino-6-(5-phosphoribosylamino)uracil reductase RibD [Oribacterium sp.]